MYVRNKSKVVIVALLCARVIILQSSSWPLVFTMKPKPLPSLINNCCLQYFVCKFSFYLGCGIHEISFFKFKLLNVFRKRLWLHCDCKGQTISKANYGFLHSPNKNEQNSTMGPFKFCISKEVGRWGQEMVIFADLQYYLCWYRWVGGWA